MARTTYKTCMNTTQLDELKTISLIKTIDELGGWPLLRHGTWRPEDFNLTELLSEARGKYGTDAFFQLYVYADSRNTTRNTLFVC